MFYCSLNGFTNDLQKLKKVKRIYLLREEQFEISSAAKEYENRMINNLTKELSNNEFIIVENKEEADAFLKGEIGDIVVLDGAQPDPPEYQIDYNLFLSTGQKTAKH